MACAKLNNSWFYHHIERKGVLFGIINCRIINPDEQDRKSSIEGGSIYGIPEARKLRAESFGDWLGR